MTAVPAVEPVPAVVVAAGWLTLRPWGAADVGWVYDTCQDPEIGRWARVPVPYTPRHALALLELSATARAQGRGAPFAITVTETGELLGAIGLGGLDRAAATAEVGFWLAAEARGRGVVTEALAALGRWAATELGVRTLYADVLAGNVAGERALARGGFEPTGQGPPRTGAPPGKGDPTRRFVKRLA